MYFLTNRNRISCRDTKGNHVKASTFYEVCGYFNNGKINFTMYLIISCLFYVLYHIYSNTPLFKVYVPRKALLTIGILVWKRYSQVSLFYSILNAIKPEIHQILIWYHFAVKTVGLVNFLLIENGTLCDIPLGVYTFQF